MDNNEKNYGNYDAYGNNYNGSDINSSNGKNPNSSNNEVEINSSKMNNSSNGRSEQYNYDYGRDSRWSNGNEENNKKMSSEDDKGYNSDDAKGKLNSGNLKDASFYKETYARPKERKNAVLAQLIVVAMMSSILGGTFVGVFFQFVAPALSPTVKSMAGSDSSNKVETSSKMNSDSYKKVVIESADSPVAAIAEKVGPTVVGISIQAKSLDFFLGPSDSQSSGSGIIIKKDGYIMTNYHVIEAALGETGTMISSGAKIEVILPNDVNKPYSAKVVGVDPKTDLAVIKIEAKNLPVMEFGDSDKVRVGELSVAIGNPGGLEYMGSVTVGVVSGLNRTIPVGDGKQLKLIQTDASINPGNSGGALVNSKGELIGVNTAKIGGSGYEGLGFAIPVNQAKEITDSLIEFNYVKGRPYLGISIETRFDEEMAKANDVPFGIYIKDVSPFSGAYKAGLQIGDIITKFDGVKVESYDELEEQKNKHKPGDVVAVEVYRDGETLVKQVELGEEK